MTRDNKQLTKIVAASLLGDGTINREGTKNGRFKLRQKTIHQDHMLYLATYLEELTEVKFEQVVAKDVTILGKQTHQKEAILLRTMAHPFYTKFRERMYGTGKKSVDPHYLTLLDWEFLAIWYMQDGFVNNTRADCIHAQAVICTDNFSYGDNMLLRHALIEKLGLVWNINHKSKNADGDLTYRLYLNRKQFDVFREKIDPFIQPSFKYKLLSHVERLTLA